MASGPIDSWQIGGETMEAVRDFFWWVCSKITADGDCSHEIRRRLLLERIAINLDRILKRRDIICQQMSANQSCGFSSSHVWM